ALLTASHAADLDEPTREAYRKRAGAVAAQLARSPDLPTAIQGRCMYYFDSGDDEALLEVVRQGKLRVDNSDAFTSYELLGLYRRKRFDQAIAVHQTSRWGDPW